MVVGALIASVVKIQLLTKFGADKMLSYYKIY